MNNLVNIINQDNPYRVCKLFQNRVRHLSNYLIKTIGVNHIEKKRHSHKKIKEGKSMKAAIYNHMLRKMKSKLNAKNLSYENTTSP